MFSENLRRAGFWCIMQLAVAWKSELTDKAVLLFLEPASHARLHFTRGLGYERKFYHA